jgi:dimethyl sulfoxide reductase iron-sulfur subunit
MPTTTAVPDLRDGPDRRTVLAAFAAAAALGGAAVPLVAYRADAATTSPGPDDHAGHGATPAAVDDAAGPVAAQPEHAWCMVIDLRYCDGCKSCTKACQKRHSLRPEQTWIQVFEMEDERGGSFHMPRPCMMCEDPPCLKVCPVGATTRTDEGLVLVDTDTCVGSRACMAACPYEARYFNWREPRPPVDLGMPNTPQMPVAKRGTVGKCVLCADRLPLGEMPACVEACPMGVLWVGDLVADVAVNTQGASVVLSQFLRDNDAVRFKEELGTHPRVWYILGHGQKLQGA